MADPWNLRRLRIAGPMAALGGGRAGLLIASVAVLTLVMPLAVSAIVHTYPIWLASALDAGVAAAVFRFARNDPAGRIKMLQNIADVLWSSWSFLGIMLLFGSVDFFAGLDLKSAVVALKHWPIAYGLIANGLLSTAAIRTALALSALFSVNDADPGNRNPRPLNDNLDIGSGRMT